MLRLEHINKRYGRNIIINDFNLELEPGTFFGFMGTNGSGKTTLLRIAACLLKPDSGDVYVDQINARKQPHLARNHIGYVPDHFGLYDSLTVEEYMEFYAGTYGLDGLKARYLCLDILKSMHLEDHRQAFVDTLSRGMKQRLCMARALIHNPDILILDEPFTGIDTELQKEMNELCHEMVRNGKIVMFSSHQLDDMAAICNKVGVLKDGRLQVCATLDEITNNFRMTETIEIVVNGQMERLKQFLKEDAGVKSLSIQGNTAVIRCNFTPDEEADLLARIVGAGIPVTAFSKNATPVERIFDSVMNEKRRIM